MPVRYRVAAIVAESQPASPCWQDDPAMSAPSLIQPRQNPPYWLAGAFALPSETAAIQTDYGSRSLNLQWVLPVSLAGVVGDQAQPLNAGLTSITSQSPKLTGKFANGVYGLTVSTSLQQVLGTAQVVLWFAVCRGAQTWVIWRISGSRRRRLAAPASECGRSGRKGLLEPHRDQLLDQRHRKGLIDTEAQGP